MTMPRAGEVFKEQADTLRDAVREVFSGERAFEEEELSPEVKAKFEPKRVRIVIIRNSDGQRRFVYTDFTSRFWWEDGNGGCDCVRHVEFERAANPDFVDNDENPCGTDRYDIELPPHMTGDDE